MKEMKERKKERKATAEMEDGGWWERYKDETNKETKKNKKKERIIP